MSSPYSVARLRRAVRHFVGGRAVQALMRAALLLLIVRLLPAADYGAYMLIIGVAEMLLLMGSFGLLPVGQRYLPQLVEGARVRDTRRFVVVLALLQMLLLGLLCVLFFQLWEFLLPYLGFTSEQIERTRPAVVLFLLIPAFRFMADLLEALLEQGKAQVARIMMPLGRLTGIAALLLSGTTVTLGWLLLVDAVVTLACVALAWLLMASTLKHLVEPARAAPLPLRDMVRHGWHMAAVNLLGSAQQPGALRVVLANSLGIVESGLFAFLQSLQRLVGRYLPGVLLSGLVRPMLVSRRGRQDGMQLMEHSLAMLTKVNLVIIAGAAVGVAVGGDAIVHHASGGKFAGAGDTLLLMFLALVVTSQRQVLEMMMQVLNQTHVLRLTALLAPVTLVAVWLSAVHGGLNLAIVVYAVGAGVSNVLCMWWLRLATGRFTFDAWSMASILLPAVVAVLLGKGIDAVYGPWVAFAGAGALLLVMLTLTKPFASGELKLADRGLGRIGRLALQPFVRKGVA